MAGAQVLTSNPEVVSLGDPGGCPRCEAAWDAVPPVTTSLFDEAPLRRCSRCGCRAVLDEHEARAVLTCRRCGLAFRIDETTSEDHPHCPDCREGRLPEELPVADMTSATEAEFRAALGESWRFVSSPSLSVYLNRIAREVAKQMGHAPEQARIAVFDDPAMTTVALPSGALLISVGTLAGLEDEAELVFVVAHELAHAISGDSAVRLVRLGFHAVAHDETAPSREGWVRAARDLMALGYGRDSEREADARALEAVVELGYDPQSVMGYLERVESRMERGDTEVRQIAASHPPPAERRRLIERAVYGRVDEAMEAPRVNREVFRRAAGHGLLASELARVDGFDVDDEALAAASRRAAGQSRFLWTTAGILVLAALFLVVGILLAR